jgi:hypothetical protein
MMFFTRSLVALTLILAVAGGQAQELTIPSIDKVPRINRSSPRPPAQVLRTSAFILKFKEHPVTGKHYVILTDHQEDVYLKPLYRLAKHREGTLLQVEDLNALATEQENRQDLQEKLRNLDVKFLAIAPRTKSYRENTLLALWETLTTLDDDPQLDVYPGILMASNPRSFARLIQQSIDHQPRTAENVKPLAISQVRTRSELRSLQKAGILRNVFASYGIKTPIVAIYSPEAKGSPELPGDDVWNLSTAGPRKFVTRFPEAPAQALQESSLVVMHGHGIPGMSCSVDIDAIPVDFSGKIVLSGSCFSASPVQSDLPAMSRAPGGYTVSKRAAFATQCVDQGSLVFFGHMRLSSGFPHLYPVLEQWLAGKTVGESYQQLINGIIGMRGYRSGKFIVPDPARAERRLAQNTALYVVLGDPALVPVARLSKK